MKKPSGVQTDGSARSLVDVAAIDQLARIVSKYDLSEIEIGLGDLQVRLARERGPAIQTRATAVPAEAPPAANPFPSPPLAPPAAGPPAADLTGAVKSPMVGTAYLRANPETKPFVEVGSMVKGRDELLLVEARKTFTDILATRAGRIVSLRVEDGSRVECDQPLMFVESPRYGVEPQKTRA